MRKSRGRLAAAMLASSLVLGACAPAISGSAENITRLERARTANPNSESTVRSLGIAYFKANRYDAARTALAGATSMDPNDGVAALYLGLTAEAQNDLPAARSAYETYLKVGQTRRVKDEISDRLQVIRLKEVQAQAKAELAREAQRASVPGPANTVAVMPFTFTGSDTSLKPLERGFAELVTTDLSRSSRLTVVERARLQALLDELALQQAVRVDSGTGVRAGRILQVSKMVGGSIVQQGEQLQASAIVTDVSSSTIGRPATDQEQLDQLFKLENNIVFGLFSSLRVPLTTAERNAIEQRPTRSLQAFLAYSRGLELEDEGRFDDASRAFDEALRLDPNFAAAQQKSQEAKSAANGTRVTSASVEASLRGTREGDAVSAAAPGVVNVGSVAGSAITTADILNPSTAGAATTGLGSVTVQPPKEASSATGGDNVTTHTAIVTITLTQPGKKP